MEENIRINKFLSDSGICSRRQADAYIDLGWVRINDTVAKRGMRVSEQDQVYVQDKPVHRRKRLIVLAFYKPKGLVCSMNGQGAETVAEYLQYPVRLHYVGRLDKDSEGLLLLTNDGDLADAVSRARNRHEKEYEVRVNKPVTKEFLRQMAEGIPILDTVTRPCKVRKLGATKFSIILTQGLNRQIRRMCEYCGYRVKTLKRIRIMNITLEGLQEGEYRELTPEELQGLRKRLSV